MLLLVKNPRDAIPIAPIALTRAQATKKKLAELAGARIFYQNGDVREVSHVRVLKLYGIGFIRKIVSALTSAWLIQVDLSAPLELSVDQKKSMLLDHLHQQSTLLLEGEHECHDIVQGLAAATTATGLFEALKVPPESDCLDVL